MLSLRGPDPSFKDAVGWARHGLPPLHGRRRQQWVTRAVEEAQAHLIHAENVSEELLRPPEVTAQEFMWQ